MWRVLLSVGNNPKVRDGLIDAGSEHMNIHRSRFGKERLARILIEQMWVDELDRYVAGESLIMRAHHDAHAPGADEFFDAKMLGDVAAGLRKRGVLHGVEHSITRSARRGFERPSKTHCEREVALKWGGSHRLATSLAYTR